MSATIERTKVLVVEDEALIAMDIRQRLERLGYSVVAVASSAGEAIELAEVESPGLVLMDIVLEGDTDGIEAARQIRERHRLPVIFVTSYTDDETIARAGLVEPFGYIAKPFSDRELHSTMQIALYRHAGEETMRRQREWLDALLHSLGDAVVATDEEGHVRLVNKVAERLTGWREKEAVGHRFSEIVSLLDTATRLPLDPVLDVLRSTGRKHGERFILLARNGTEIIVEDSTSVIPSSDCPGGCAFVFRDITARLNAEQTLLHVQRMESLGRMAGGVAHEFNNLLTVIMGTGSSGLEASAADSENAQRYRDILAAADHGAAVARKLLAIGGRQVIDRQPVDVNQVLRDLRPAMERVIGEGISLRVESEAIFSRILADRQQLEHAILNLFLNACEAIPGRGQITVRADNVSPATAPHSEHGDCIRITVSDTGVGMTPEVRSRIFEPFFTTKEASFGAGLGLSTAYGIVAQSGGHIEVSSTVGMGSSLSIFLPLAKDSGSVVVSSGAVPAAKLVSTILLVDDDNLVRRLEATILDGAGFEIQQASNGAEALELFNSGPGGFDILVTDVLMPGMSGIDLARRIRAARPEIPVLFVSGFSGDFMNMDEFPPRLTAFLQKPFSPLVLQKAVDDLLKSAGV